MIAMKEMWKPVTHSHVLLPLQNPNQPLFIQTELYYKLKYM